MEEEPGPPGEEHPSRPHGNPRHAACISQLQQAGSQGGPTPSSGPRLIAIKPELGSPRPRGAVQQFLGWSGCPSGNFSARRRPVTLLLDTCDISFVS